MLRLGEDAILRPHLTESYIPELAWHGLSGHESSRAESPCHAIATRPLHLLEKPVEIPVMVSPSHDRDGRPISFTYENNHHRVTHSTGPERIAGQWWQNHLKTRDYFAIETESALRLWLFRVHETNKWYVHGKFE
jgi:protein ImuB